MNVVWRAHVQVLEGTGVTSGLPQTNKTIPSDSDVKSFCSLALGATVVLRLSCFLCISLLGRCFLRLGQGDKGCRLSKSGDCVSGVGGGSPAVLWVIPLDDSSGALRALEPSLPPPRAYSVATRDSLDTPASLLQQGGKRHSFIIAAPAAILRRRGCTVVLGKWDARSSSRADRTGNDTAGSSNFAARHCPVTSIFPSGMLTLG